MLRWFPGVAIAVIVATGCKDDPPPAPPVAVEPALPRAPRAPLAGEVVVARNDAGLVTMARPIRVLTSPSEGIGVILHWEDEDGRIGPEHPLGKQAVDWPATIGTLRVRVTPPGADAPRELTLGGDAPSLRTRPLGEGPTLTLWIEPDGVRVASRERPYAEAAPALLSAAGTYRVQLAGQLVLAEDRVPFESGQIEVEVADRAMQPTPALETAAAKLVAKHRKLDEPPLPVLETVDDVEGNRVVRFTVPIGTELLTIEVVVAPDGEILSVNEARWGRDSLTADTWDRTWRRPGGAK